MLKAQWIYGAAEGLAWFSLGFSLIDTLSEAKCANISNKPGLTLENAGRSWDFSDGCAAGGLLRSISIFIDRFASC